MSWYQWWQRRALRRALGSEYKRWELQETEARSAEAEAFTPPLLLRYKTVLCPDLQEYRTSGTREVQRILQLLADCHAPIPTRILDFGCGAGRLAYAFTQRLPEATVAACEQDGACVRWLQQHLPAVTTRRTRRLPPAPWADDAFDLIVCLSVFTHLDEHHQDRWLAEIFRLLAPGGWLIATTQGWHRLRQLQAAGHPFRPGWLEQWQRDGLYFDQAPCFHPFYPKYYQNTLHTPAYIRHHWSRWFRIVRHLPGSDRGLPQDLIAARRR